MHYCLFEVQIVRTFCRVQREQSVQVVLSGFSMRLFCFVQAKTLCWYGCMYLLAELVPVCVDVMVVSSA